MRRKKKAQDKNAPDKKRVRLTKKKFAEIGFHIWRQFDDTYYTGFAAQIAYFFFMSSIPTLVVLTQLLGIFDLSLDIIQKWIEENTDTQVNGFVMGLFKASSASVLNVVLIVLALWAASSLEFSLARLTSHTLTEGNYRFHFWQERIKAIPTAILSIVAVAFTLIIFVYGDHFFSTQIKSYTFARYLLILKVPIAAALFFLMVLVNYYILPRIRVPLVSVLPGAIIASLGVMLMTVFYAIYIGYIADYNILYGSFANIVVLMFWFYLISWILCIGMMFNKAWDDVMEKGRLTPEKMFEYFEKQYKDSGEDYKKFFILDEDKYGKTETIASKMSKQFIKDFNEKEEAAEKETWSDRAVKRKAEKLALEKFRKAHRREKLLFILNPKAGQMQAVKFLPEIIQAFEEGGFLPSVMFTSKSGDARHFAAKYAVDFDLVVCAGGDGTLNEVIEGLMDVGIKRKIGYIPAGSTNDFAASIGLPKGIMDAVSVVVSGKPKTFDIGNFNGRHFSYVASFGAFTSTSYSVPQNIKNIMGHTAYVLQGIKNIVNIKPILMKLVADEGTPNETKIEGDYIFGAVCNARSLAGILSLDSFDIDMNDGLLEVLLIKSPENLIELNAVVKSLIDGTLETEQIKFFSAKEVKITMVDPVDWTVDGEFAEGAREVKVTTVRSAIELITDSGSTDLPELE